MPKQSQDKIQARGVGLKVSEWRELERIAGEIGITPHAVLQYAVRRFVVDYKAGRIKTQTKKVNTLPDLE